MENRIPNNSGRNNIGQLLLLYVIWPFGAWIASLRQANTRGAYVIFFLFSLLLCWHMSPTGVSQYDDFIGIKERFEETNVTTDEIIDEFKAFITFSVDAPKELYGDFLTWIVKLFTHNYHFFFLLAAIPVAFCQLKCLKYITDDPRFIAGSFLSLLVMVMFIFPRDIITVQNPRFVTGLWLCILITIRYALNNNNRLFSAILILLGPFFHSAIWVYVLLFYICLLIPRSNKTIRLLEMAAICSIPLCFIDADLFSNLSFDFLPSNISIWISWYMNEEAKAKLLGHEGASGFWMVGVFFGIALKCCYIFMTYQMIKNRKNIAYDSSMEKLYICYLVLFSFINLFQFVPELGSRYFYITRILCMLVWFKMFWGQKHYYKSFYLLCIISSWHMLFRYGYIFGGALSVNTPLDMWVTPLPYLIGKGLIW